MSKVKKYLQEIWHQYKTIKILKEQVKTYMRCSEKIVNPQIKAERADYVLAVAVHSIEKGLGYKDIKKGFGEAKARRVCKLMENYLLNGFPEDRFGFKEAYAMMARYIEYKRNVNENIEDIETWFEKIKSMCTVDMSTNKYQAGGIIYSKEEIKCDNPDEIIAFKKKCHSIRNYLDREVEEEDIKSAVNLANLYPSACNRQPVSCYYTMNKDEINAVDNIIPGNVPIRGTTPNYLVVTAKMSHFSVDEYNQWYINGGIYLGYLREALCIHNIGNCIYQWKFNEDESKVREIYNIPENEVIIAFVGIGYYDEKSYCIAAQRKGN